MAVDKLPYIGDNAFEDGFLNRGWTSKVIDRINRQHETGDDTVDKARIEESEQSVKHLHPQGLPKGNGGDILINVAGKWVVFSKPQDNGTYFLSVTIDSEADAPISFEWIEGTECP